MSRSSKSLLVRILIGTYLQPQAIRGCGERQIAQREANSPLFEIAFSASAIRSSKAPRKATPVPTKQAAYYNQPSHFTVWRLFVSRASPLFKIARVLVRFDHVASVIVNASASRPDFY
jgi:hypothetical protein